ncbi:MAG: hypothetical protein ACREF0_07045 [Acetobacteraceae bacterium]
MRRTSLVGASMDRGGGMGHAVMTPKETGRYDPEMLDSLERSQLTQFSERPLPRRRLGRAAVVLLVLLRIYVLIAIPIVAYAFVRALLGH